MRHSKTYKLDEICDVEYGDRVVKKLDGGSVYPVYGGGGATFKMDIFNRKDRLIVSRFGISEQCTRFVLGEFYLNDSGLTVAPKNNALKQRYIDYQLLSLNSMIYSLGRGTAQKNLDMDQFRKLPIIVPNELSEQDRIVEILDLAFASLEKMQANAVKNLQNVKELFDSYLDAILNQKSEGWIEQKLGDCFRLKSGDGLTSKDMKEGTFPVFGGNGMAGMHNAYNLSGSNVIIGRVGALCGNVRHVTENIWLTDNAFRIVDFNHSFDNTFLAYLLNFKKLRGLARQSAQPVISNSSLKDLLLNFPKSVAEQQRIGERLGHLAAEINRLEAVYQKKLDILVELKQSFLHKAFTGELTSSDITV